MISVNFYCAAWNADAV